MADATADTLREAVLGLVENPEVARRATGIRLRVATEGGARRAADLIEAELGPVPRGA